MATLVPCLVVLRATFDDLFPGRDRASDGWIGDASHAARASDHNPDSRGLVHAIDVDANLGPGATMRDVVRAVVARCHAGAERRLTYVIYDRQIASASHGWTWRPYDGTSPHTEHAHFSASSVPARENDRSSWHLDEFGGDDMLVKKGDSGDEVKFWQLGLADLGYDVGTPDGAYGPKMEAAVNAFRKAHGAAPASRIDPWTAWAILRESAIVQAKKYAGKDGAPGQLTGRLTVTGGQLVVEAAAA